jgi:hypothetical protein
MLSDNGTITSTHHAIIAGTVYSMNQEHTAPYNITGRHSDFPTPAAKIAKNKTSRTFQLLPQELRKNATKITVEASVEYN